MKNFIVTAKCGHVSRKYYIPIAFPVYAENKKAAALKVKTFPRVKKDHSDVILNVREVTFKEYMEQIEINKNDEYLNCDRRKNQELIEGLKDRLVLETNNTKSYLKKNTRRHSFLVHLEKKNEMRGMISNYYNDFYL